MATILGKPGVLLFGRTEAGAIVPMLVDADGALVESSASLPFQVANDGDPVLKNESGDVVFSVDGNGNPKLQGVGVAAGYIGFNDEGSPTVHSEYVNFENENFTVNGLAGSGIATFGSGVPVRMYSTGIAASYTTDLGVPNADLVFTANSVGQAGNGPTVQYENDGANTTLHLEGSGTIFTVYLGTDGASVITSTAGDVLGLLNGESRWTDIATADVAPGNNGSGIPTVMSLQALSGGLSALNVTGPSWLDSGAITTDGSGRLFAAIVQAGDGTEASVRLSADGATIGVQSGNTDDDLAIGAKGAGTINLNSATTIANQLRVDYTRPGQIAYALFGNLSETASAGSEMLAYTVGDAATGNAIAALQVHADGTNQAQFSITLDGNSGNDTPDTEFAFPGAVIFTGGDSYTFTEPVSIQGALTIDEIIPVSDGFAFNATLSGAQQFFTFNNLSQTASAGAAQEISSRGNAATGDVATYLTVHAGGSNESGFNFSVAGNSGNATPNTSFNFPGAALFAGASSYNFDNFLAGIEISAPAAPAANGFRIYGVDVAGKTALMVKFGSGAAQQIAIEP